MNISYNFREIFSKYSVDICYSPQKFESLLKDYLQNNIKLINLLLLFHKTPLCNQTIQMSNSIISTNYRIKLINQFQSYYELSQKISTLIIDIWLYSLNISVVSPKAFKTVLIGDYVKYGNMIWKCIDKIDSKVQLILNSTNIIHVFSKTKENANWNNCELNKYLNSNEGFLSNFSKIEVSYIENNNNENIFILSKNNYEKYAIHIRHLKNTFLWTKDHYSPNSGQIISYFNNSFYLNSHNDSNVKILPSMILKTNTFNFGNGSYLDPYFIM